MICELCRQDKELRNSHIIPEFLFKSCYDLKHRSLLLSLDKDVPQGYIQQGMKEKLLCDECEIKLSRYEKYASEVFSGKIAIRSERLFDGENYMQLHGLNYKSFRLFGLSIIWRAGISSHKMFRDVKLGLHQEEIRKLLYSEDPGDPLIYPFIFEALVEKDIDPRGLMLKPTRHRFFKFNSYRFVFGGFIGVFVVSKQKVQNELAPILLNEKGEMILKIVRLKDVGFIKDSLIEIVSKRHQMIDGPE